MLRVEGKESDEEGRRDRHRIKSASYFLNRPKNAFAVTTENYSYTIGSLADATVLYTISFDSFTTWLGLLASITYCFYLKTSLSRYN
jgi:hypothetical protein